MVIQVECEHIRLPIDVMNFYEALQCSNIHFRSMAVDISIIST